MKLSLDDSTAGCPGPANISPMNISRHLSGSEAHQTSTDASLFSSSLPVLPHEKLMLNDKGHSCQSIDDIGSDKLSQVLGDAVEDHIIGSLLPDDENELLAGITDDFDLSGLPCSIEDLEDYDFFGSGGGMELEADMQDNLGMGIMKVSLSDPSYGNSVPSYVPQNSPGAAVATEHPFGEHPSRTLFVRNINSNVEDLELKTLFEQYGDIRTLYTACKHRGFVMISYYDIRAARQAMRLLQNKPLRRRKLDIHFSIPKDNPSEKDVNQGTLVAFNLDPSVSNEDLRQIFGHYGEVKEIRETPHKRHHKFIEFYDVRAADAALKGLHRSDIAGKRIKLEPSRPGGARRNLMLQLNQDCDQDDSRNLHQIGSPIANSPPSNWLPYNSPIERSSCGFRPISPTTNNHLSGLSSLLSTQGSTSVKIAPIGKDQGRVQADHPYSSINSGHGTSFQHFNSFPELKMGHYNGNSNGANNIETLSGPQFLWGSPKSYPEHTGSSVWSTSVGDNSYLSNGKGQGFPLSTRQGSFLSSSQPHYHHHHVGSAPSGVPLERHFGFFPESSDASFRNPASLGGFGLGQNDSNFVMNTGPRNPMNININLPRNIPGNGSSNFRMMSSQRPSPMLLSSGLFAGQPTTGMEGFSEYGRSQREANMNQMDNKKQYQLDLDKIISGEDTRTTLMIKNIPNKYTSKMLLAAIDENNKGTYNFLYLPIDFKNKCNVGYAFINMLSPKHIIPFYKAIYGKKWEKFNSEKVASLAYARIQGRGALVAHFQNSSLMNEDKRCRPILFHSDDPDSVDKINIEHLQANGLNVEVTRPNLSHAVEIPRSSTIESEKR